MSGGGTCGICIGGGIKTGSVGAGYGDGDGQMLLASVA